MFLPGIIDITESKATKAKNAVTNPAPFANSIGFNIPISLTATTIRRSVVANFLSILPALSAFCADLPLTMVPKAARTNIIAPTSATNPSIP